MTHTDKPIVLASGSPRRRELLAKMGYTFTICVPDVDEHTDAPANEAVAYLAQRKARAVAKEKENALIIASDTLVSLEGKALGKPVDAEDAKRMLMRLSGRAHDIYTGVCVIETPQMKEALRVAHSSVVFRELTEEEIERYVATGEPMDKAGAYAIQGGAGAFVTEIHGSFENIMGLPVDTLAAMLETF